ncbi:hypothetical protein BD324DRAFT_607949 [Kockovaella imperatae]|uniref:E3 ubiquitin-protein ligase listerin n=1 Tax=Kockovaella imperatae TaxID=4999 RepID=A0A1Y1UKH8_9TREE|nr:hypothetical protein BD324DRAFT_607949 [Kockovaella imperatae]ORX38482.1 hypothetical protein BD324DRAFT_607949 [Kockovaella imperatae]
MPKGTKSSASSGTRKKHAKKAAKGDAGSEQQNQQQQGQNKKSKKLTKAEKKAKVKQYIPPPKPPAPAIPDPLDSQGLAHTLPPELVVILRRIGKKDAVTKRKGLDELREQWLTPPPSTTSEHEEEDEIEREIKEAALATAIPVWLHNLAQLLQSPSHRTSALQIQQALLNRPSTRNLILDSFNLSLLPGNQTRDTLGSWLVAAVEERRRAGGASYTCWMDSTSFGPQDDRLDLTPHLDSLADYLELSIADPASLNDSIFPSPIEKVPIGSEEEAWFRVGGLTGLTWLLTTAEPSTRLLDLLRGDIWSTLSPVEPSLGSGQPSVRRAAYALLDTVPDDCLPQDLLSFCWREAEGTVFDIAGPVIAKLLRRHPDWWEQDEDEDDEEEEDTGSPFSDFLQFVASVCPSVPHVTYPLLLVAVSTMSSDILPLDLDDNALPSFFSHLWSPVDARLLSTHSLPNQTSALQTFLQAALDCIALLLKRAIKEEDTDIAEWLVETQLCDRAWRQCVLEFGGKSARARTPPGENEAVAFASAATRVKAISSDLYATLLESITSTLVSKCFGEDRDTRLLPRAVILLDTLDTAGSEDSVRIVDVALERLVQASLDEMRNTDTDPKTGLVLVSDIVREHSDALQDETIDQIYELCGKDALVQSAPNQLLDLLRTLENSSPSAKSDKARQVVQNIVSSPTLSTETRFSFVAAALQLQYLSLFPEDAIGDLAEEGVQHAILGDQRAAVLVAQCIRDGTLPQSNLDTVLSLCSTAIQDAARDFSAGNAASASLQPSALIFYSYARDHLQPIIDSDVFLTALVDLYLLHGLSAVAFDQTVSSMLDEQLPLAPSKFQATLREAMSQQLTDISNSVNLLPTPDVIRGLLDSLIAQSADPTLPIIDPLAPYTGESISPDGLFDSTGLSKCARVLQSILALFREDRNLPSREPILLSACLLGHILARDGLSVNGGSRGLASSTDSLETFVREAETILSSVFATIQEPTSAWHKQTIVLVKSDGTGSQSDWIQSTLADLLQSWSRTGSDVSLRAVHLVLTRILGNERATEADSAAWLDLAMTLSTKKPDLASTIILAIKGNLEDSQAISTARNRLANSITGIKAKDIGVTGLPALRLLLASAPLPDSTSDFIPQQRAIFVLRHVSGWLTDDDAEDLPEETEFRLAELFNALGPVVQDVPGQHWDAIFDLLENGLESSLCYLCGCLVLLRTVRDLCATNKSLRAAWTNRDVLSKQVLKLFTQCRNDSSEPMKRIQALLLDLVMGIDEAQDSVSSGLVSELTISQLSHLLLLSTNWGIQTMAYRLLSQVIRRETLALVLKVEATIGDEAAEETQSIQLPASLIKILEDGASIDWQDPQIPQVVTQILAWMAILDHFDDASRTIRSAYMDQLRSGSLIERSLLSMLFQMMGVSQVGAWNFPAGQFAVDEFYPELLEPEELADLTPFASYLFYRTLISVPSILREIHEGIKDRQLSLSMLNFTARYYSPVIIQKEFAALRQPATISQLSAEGLTVRVAQAGTGSAEAIASYVVDEQPMEIGIRLPAEFPLRGVDVRDLRRVGVPENKWRGWLMSVQQTITSRNGLILEALTVFKRNVSLHFEGVVECAICYSIISLTDRTLPTKPCRTCKNRFHASCLFKWFNSSHSSSCPLCRTLF